MREKRLFPANLYIIAHLAEKIHNKTENSHIKLQKAKEIVPAPSPYLQITIYLPVRL